MGKEIETQQFDFEKINPWHVHHFLHINFTRKQDRKRKEDTIMYQYIWDTVKWSTVYSSVQRVSSYNYEVENYGMHR